MCWAGRGVNKSHTCSIYVASKLRNSWYGTSPGGTVCRSGGMPPDILWHFCALRQFLVQSEANILQ